MPNNYSTKRTRAHTDAPAATARPLKRARYDENAQQQTRATLARTRLAHHAPPTLPVTSSSTHVALLRPCAHACTTWDEAMHAFVRLGHGGSVVCRRDDGATRFVGTVPSLQAWWRTRRRAPSLTAPTPVVLEENLWSRHPQAATTCLRYTYDNDTDDHPNIETVRATAEDTLAVLQPQPPRQRRDDEQGVTATDTSRALARSLTYAWSTSAVAATENRIGTTSLRRIAAAARAYVRAHRSVLPGSGALDLCRFDDDHHVYIVDCIPHTPPKRYKAHSG